MTCQNKDDLFDADACMIADLKHVWNRKVLEDGVSSVLKHSARLQVIGGKPCLDTVMGPLSCLPQLLGSMVETNHLAFETTGSAMVQIEQQKKQMRLFSRRNF